MQLPDVDDLIYAHREESPGNPEYRQWLVEMREREAPSGITLEVLSGFLRVVTHPRVFDVPTPLMRALEFTDVLIGADNCLVVRPGPRHWEIFTDLCRRTAARGNLVPDAYLAAIAIEADCEWLTTDRDFSRFPGLRWRHPLG